MLEILRPLPLLVCNHTKLNDRKILNRLKQMIPEHAAYHAAWLLDRSNCAPHLRWELLYQCGRADCGAKVKLDYQWYPYCPDKPPGSRWVMNLQIVRIVGPLGPSRSPQWLSLTTPETMLSDQLRSWNLWLRDSRIQELRELTREPSGRWRGRRRDTTYGAERRIEPSAEMLTQKPCQDISMKAQLVARLRAWAP